MQDRGGGKGVLQQLEEKFGLPHLSKVAETFDKFPDAKQLSLIKDVLVIADKLSTSAPELDKVIELIRELNSVPIEKLEKLERILKKVEGIMKKAPEELLSFLTSLKEE